MSRIVALVVLAAAAAACDRQPRPAPATATPDARAALVTAGRVAPTPGSQPAARGPRPAPPASAPRPAAEAPPPGPRFGGEPAAAGLSPACNALVEEHKRVAVAATGRCTKDAECACYASPWLEFAGRVTDSVTVARLGEIRSDYQREGCPLLTTTFRTAPPACVPQCVGGRCTVRR